MREGHELEYRKFIIGGVSIAIVIVYLLRLLVLQVFSSEYKIYADSNAFLKRVEYPARGVITDRNGRLMVYNRHSYDIMVVMNEAKELPDTMALCDALGITREYFDRRMSEIKDRSRNPGYSRFTQQLFISQLEEREFRVFQERMYRFPGFYVQRRSVRQYLHPWAAHVLGYISEASPADIEDDAYYQPGDYIGKAGVERSYERQLRGEKGIQILLRDAHGSVKGRYMDGRMDRKPVPGKDLTLSIDLDLQALGERLMEGKRGSIVAIEPATGEVLCMVSSPTYDPRTVAGRRRGGALLELQRDLTNRPMLNRAIMGQYPPGSTFKTTQGLTYMSEGIITPQTMYPCYHGFYHKGLHVGCHGHASPLALVPSISTSCNGYFCWGLYYMLSNRKKYKDVQTAMNTWRDYMVSMGFGYRLGIDLPGEKRGLIPDAEYYDKHYNRSWNGLTVVSIAIGQGEVTATPLQIANLGATIANRGYYITPHVVRSVKGDTIARAYSERHYTMAPQTNYDYIVQGMRASVLGGTCRSLAGCNFVACGKTGTAQNRGKDHSVFMGFAPMDNPQIAVAVYVENGGWGAEYGVPIGGLIMERYINGSLSETSLAKAEAIQKRHIYY